MPTKKPRPSKVFYAPELTPPELKNFEHLRSGSPADEIALLRILIRRMLHTLNHVQTFPEAIQSINALSYLTGRLAKLFEVSTSTADPSSDFSNAYLLSLQQVLHNLHLPPPTGTPSQITPALNPDDA